MSKKSSFFSNFLGFFQKKSKDQSLKSKQTLQKPSTLSSLQHKKFLKENSSLENTDFPTKEAKSQLERLSERARVLAKIKRQASAEVSENKKEAFLQEKQNKEETSFFLLREQLESTLSELSNTRETKKNKAQIQQSNQDDELQIEVYAFVGPSGTGKSTRAIEVATVNHIDYIIDDALLIHGGQILAGTTAKKAKTRMESVKRAIFLDSLQARNMGSALFRIAPAKVLILGTSTSMIEKICRNLGLEAPKVWFNIDDFATKEEQELAKYIRKTQGKHTIPVPSMELMHQFSGYIQAPLTINKLWKRLGRESSDKNQLQMPDEAKMSDRTVVRPTFSSLGRYSISDQAMRSLISFIVRDLEGVDRIVSLHIHSESSGVSVRISLSLNYGFNAQNVLKSVQFEIQEAVARWTAINVVSVNIKAVHLASKSKQYSVI